jgi:hypothetical protein
MVTKMKMTSVCIKDINGQTLIKIYHRKGSFWVDRLSSVAPLDIIIRDENNNKVVICSQNKKL